MLSTAGGVFGSQDPFERAVPVDDASFGFERDDDLDFDRQPDDWARRKGVGFPEYIHTEIDRQVSYSGQCSLRFDLDGGKAAYYAPPAQISPHHSYIFAGRIRTLGLSHDAAILSLSFLDARRNRIQRVLSVPVSGSSEEWVEVRIGPIMPLEDVRYVAVGCHLVHGSEMDYRGTVWFDDLHLRMLPRLAVRTNFERVFQLGDSEVDVEAIVSGLDQLGAYELELMLEDSNFDVQETKRVELNTTTNAEGDGAYDASSPMHVHWTLPPREPGFYRLYARLVRDGDVVLEETTSLAFLSEPIAGKAEKPPAFGWSVDHWPEDADHDRLLAVAAEAGIGWMKLPLWETVHEGDADGQRSARVAELLQNLKRQNVRVVGVLREPPRDIRRKFADNWEGVSELFTMPSSFWMGSIESVMARYSLVVRHWQLGGEHDDSFNSITNLPSVLDELKIQFDRLGRDTMVGVHWSWGRKIPVRTEGDRSFLSLSSAPPLSEPELIAMLERANDSGFASWVLLRSRPSADTSDLATRRRDLDRRITDLLRRITAARIGEAEVIYCADVFHPRIGLLNRDASPGELFLPWRTWSHALDQAEFLGSFDLENGSTNYVFAKGDEAVVCMWNEEATDERLSLGRDMHVLNHWGQEQSLETDEHRSIIPVGPTPILLRGGSADLARFRLSARFEKGRMPSSTKEFEDAIVLTNPFPQSISGELKVSAPHDWEMSPTMTQLAIPRGETVKVPIRVRLPSSQSLGPEKVNLEFQLDGDSVYHITVGRAMVVGLGDVLINIESEVLRDGSLEIRQQIENKTEESLSFRASLFVPGQKRQKRRISNLQAGEKHTISYRVANAEKLIGRRIRIRAEQEGGSRVLNKSWIFDPEVTTY